GENRVAAIDLGSGREVASLAVGRSPCGLALTPDGSILVVANSGSGDVSLIEIDGDRLAERVRLVAGREPYAAAITPDGERALIANRLAGAHAYRAVPSAEVTILDLRRGRVERRRPLRSAHLSEGVAVSPSGGIAIVPLVRVRNLVPITQVSQGWVMTSGLGFLSPTGATLRQFPLDEVNAYFADPSGVAIDAEGSRAFVASGGGDAISVVDLRRLEELAAECEGEGPGRWADHLGISSEYVIARIPVGPNPRALLLSPGGEWLFVAERLGDSIALIDTGTLEVAGRVSLAGALEPSPERRGEIVFHRASITFQGQFSCRSCHPDGHVDGLAYDFAIDGLGKNILDNRSLRGLAGTAPFKWNGKNKNLHEQCGPRFAKVLTLADPFPPQELDDLVAFIESLGAAAPPAATEGAPTPAQARGRAIFERARMNNGEEIPVGRRCSTCHAPPLYTNRLFASVGTRASTDSVDRLDTPHLRGIGSSAPFLHDGRAGTLEEIWTVHSPGDTHGVVNDLTKTQLNDLIEFLRSI
ncbi:MAG: hypothetical protein ACE5GW_07030, partial [Planctomycetota bacterium]